MKKRLLASDTTQAGAIACPSEAASASTQDQENCQIRMVSGNKVLERFFVPSYLGGADKAFTFYQGSKRYDFIIHAPQYLRLKEFRDRADLEANIRFGEAIFRSLKVTNETSS